VFDIKNRRKGEIRKLKHSNKTSRSIRRSKLNFFRLCHHNNVAASTIHFLTLTFASDQSYKEATRHVSKFLEKIKQNYPELPLSYISVPELTKKGRYHFHCLIYDLPTTISIRERETRNLQRLWRQGYLHIDIASYTSEGIAGYMAKYMAKYLTDHKHEATRAYNCSRNIKKIYCSGSNSLSIYTDLIINTSSVEKEYTYDTIFLGTCVRKIYNQKQ